MHTLCYTCNKFWLKIHIFMFRIKYNSIILLIICFKASQLVCCFGWKYCLVCGGLVHRWQGGKLASAQLFSMLLFWLIWSIVLDQMLIFSLSLSFCFDLYIPSTVLIINTCILLNLTCFKYPYQALSLLMPGGVWYGFVPEMIEIKLYCFSSHKEKKQ